VTRKLTATQRMLRAHRDNVSVDEGPTPERAAKAEIRPPEITRAVRRDAPEIVDVLSKHATRLDWEQLECLKWCANTYVSAAASMALNSYEPRVDQGGWRSHPGIEMLLDTQCCTDLDRVRERLNPPVRGLLDVFLEAMSNPRHPCPFAKAVSMLIGAPIDRIFQKRRPSSILAQSDLTAEVLKCLADEIQLVKERNGG
jgi:hypothetical protein